MSDAILAGVVAGASAADRGYHQRIEKIEGSSMYVRIDTGPDLEESWLCVDDGEPDTHRIAKFVSLSYADAFINWNRRPALTAYEAAKGEGVSVDCDLCKGSGLTNQGHNCSRCGGSGVITAEAAKGVGVKPLLDEIAEILDEDAPDKWVWKSHASQDEWLREKVLPALRKARIVLTSPASGERDASMWATVVADDYDGSLRWDCRTAGDMGDGDSLPTIALAADTFPEGTKLVITEPALRMEGK